MTEEASPNWVQAAKNWLQTTSGLLAALTTFLGAAGALVIAVKAFFPIWGPPVSKAGGCIPGYVERLAIPDDHVCVTLQTHQQTQLDNSLARDRRDPKGGAYKADTCLSGYVWRDIFEGDHVCVTPETR